MSIVPLLNHVKTGCVSFRSRLLLCATLLPAVSFHVFGGGSW